jgi:type III secretory pathway component EscT
VPADPELSALFSAIFGADLRAWVFAWARALPLVVIVPAFGLAAVALPIRVGLAAAFAATIVPALGARPAPDAPFLLGLARELSVGLPVALSVAVLSWTAIMAGAVADDLRGARETVALPTFEEPAPPVAALLGLFVAIAFLETGGAARAVGLLAEAGGGFGLNAVVTILAGSMRVALSIAAPFVAGSLLIELAGALIARAANPAHVLPLLAPLRSLALLAIVWIAFDRVAELLVLLAQAR